MLIVTAHHRDERWRLDHQDFAVQEDGEFGQYRVGGDAHNGYHASGPRFGCGKDYPSPRAAIRHLLEDNGCYGISIV